MEIFALASFVVLVNERVNEFVIKPILTGICEAAGKPELVGKLMPYVTMLTGGVLAFAFNISMLAQVGVDVTPVVDKILSALFIAGGSNLLHDVWPGEFEIVIEDEYPS